MTEIRMSEPNAGQGDVGWMQREIEAKFLVTTVNHTLRRYTAVFELGIG